MSDGVCMPMLRRHEKLVYAIALSLLVSQPMTGCAAAKPAAEAKQSVLPMPPPGSEERHLFANWLKDFRTDALKQGIAPDVFDRATKNIVLDEEVIAADRSQPEFSKPVWAYLNGALGGKRVEQGRTLLSRHAALLDRIEKTYGVDRYIVVAIWGLESNFGEIMGRRNVVQSLATLGFEGRRPDFGKTQLVAALRIIQSGDIEAGEMTGSWAGAMGQTQFLPTTYLAHAVDFDKDGRRDIWHSTADALASAAAYLSVSGWTPGAGWGYEVTLPAGFDYSLADMAETRSVSAWRALGIKRADGAAFPSADTNAEAAIFLPAGYRGPAFMTLGNFKTILSYNASTSYALAVHLLAERFRGKGEIRKSWPVDERTLSRSERMELQELLNARGHEAGKPDAIIGYQTRKAIRAFQLSENLPADGFATASLLERLRKK